MDPSNQVLNGAVSGPANLPALPKESVRRNRRIVRPLCSMSTGVSSGHLPLFAFLLRTGAIIEHEPFDPQPSGCEGRNAKSEVLGQLTILEVGGYLIGQGAAKTQALARQFTVLALLFLGIVLLGTALLLALKRWRDNPDSKPPSPSDQLATFESLYAEGKISREEYDRIRTSLTRQLRQQFSLPEKPATEATDQPRPGADAPGRNGGPNQAQS
jgi:hypothetical protein